LPDGIPFFSSSRSAYSSQPRSPPGLATQAIAWWSNRPWSVMTGANSESSSVRADSRRARALPSAMHEALLHRSRLRPEPHLLVASQLTALTPEMFSRCQCPAQSACPRRSSMSTSVAAVTLRHLFDRALQARIFHPPLTTSSQPQMPRAHAHRSARYSR